MKNGLCRSVVVVAAALCFSRSSSANAAIVVPAISTRSAREAVLEDLAYNAPTITIDLNDARRSPAVSNLERAHILRVIAKVPADPHKAGERFILTLTNHGQRVVESEGWVVEFGELQIATGRLAYVPKSLKIRRQSTGGVKIAYEWQYRPNYNVSYLLRLGPLSTWPASMYPTCLTSRGRARGTQVLRIISTIVFESDNAPIRGC